MASTDSADERYGSGERMVMRKRQRAEVNSVARAQAKGMAMTDAEKVRIAKVTGQDAAANMKKQKR